MQTNIERDLSLLLYSSKSRYLYIFMYLINTKLLILYSRLDRFLLAYFF
jgi:hypothetical protein